VHDTVFGGRLIGKGDGNIGRGSERIIARVARIRMEIHVTRLGRFRSQVTSNAAVTNSLDVASQPMQRYAELGSVDEELKVHEKNVGNVDAL